jgi:acyl carrier protein
LRIVNVEALVRLLGRYLTWGRLPAGGGLEAQVAAFAAVEGEMAVHEARDAIHWLRGDATATRLEVNPLGVDSLDAVEFMMDVEDRYGVELSDEELGALPELLERVDRLLGDWTDDEGGSSVREPRSPRPSGPSDGAVAEEPGASEP